MNLFSHAGSDQLPPAQRVRTPRGDASTNMEGYVYAESQALKLAQDALGLDPESIGTLGRWSDDA